MTHDNVFDDDSLQFVVLVNDDEQHSLWPAFIDVPAGWSVAFGADSRDACLSYVREHWSDIRPARLRDRQPVRAGRPPVTGTAGDGGHE